MDDTCAIPKVEIRRYPTQRDRFRSDGGYWKGFRTQSTQQTGAVSWLSYSPSKPHQLAATSGTRVVVYEDGRLESQKAISKFQDLAHCGSFRSDGRLLVAGTEEGTVKVFNVDDRSILRQLEGHKQAVHVSHFSSSKIHILSASDDTTVRYWDLSEGKQILRLDGHRDYVRAGSQHPSSVDSWATGGYDHVCRLWDLRQNSNVLEMDHGAPIEAVTFLPSGSLLVTAGGRFVCVWDVLGTGRMLRKLETHHKTVTAVNLLPIYQKGETQPRLASASLDHHMKIYDLTEFKVVYDARFKAPILSLASTPDGSCHAVGMSDGSITLRTNRHKRAFPSIAKPLSENTIVDKRPKLTKFDKLFVKFRYKDVLDLVLKEPDVKVVSAVIEELAARNGIVAALSNRSPDDLQSLLNYIDIHIGNPQFSDHVTPLLQILLDIYEDELAAKPLEKKLQCILRSIQRELSVLMDMKELKGSLETILGSIV